MPNLGLMNTLNSESIDHFQKNISPFAEAPTGSNLGYLNSDVRATGADDAASAWNRGK